MKLKVAILKFESDAWSYYLAVPKPPVEKLIEGEDRRVICSICGEQLHSALMPKGDIYSIYLKKELMKKHGLMAGDEVDIHLEKDRSEYGIPMPESLRELLHQDAEGSYYFHALTKGKQRSLIHIVGKVKNVDSQLAKGLAIMHHLKEAEGQLDFKRLNVLIKEYNQRK